MAPSLKSFDTLGLHFMAIFERYWILRGSPHIWRSKDWNHTAAASTREYTFEIVFKNLQTRLCFVLSQGSGHFEHLLNPKNVFLMWVILCIIEHLKLYNFENYSFLVLVISLWTLYMIYSSQTLAYRDHSNPNVPYIFLNPVKCGGKYEVRSRCRK